MELFKNVAGSVTKAVNYVVDKNRRAAMINRLKIVIRNEKEIEARSYIELGRYYYENMRDASDERTEPLCAAVDNADRRLKRAFAKLDEMMVPAGADQEEEDGCEESGCAESASDEGEDFFRSFSAAEEEPDGTGEVADDDPVI
ncbi:hypothetical protein EQM14_15825 [Caproiciproducens sp. NJN-50]|uniref:hypothetical protein n=1 Tax=Acutalibacteraceae TaxID=3082771 RepID=UPI000FFE26E5|nr:MULTISPECIES: hypothetical protein [Acutalibacteraceae]QAT51119.1 hypothetical protein EQM14_15825 [Caproiciproducens sp. NJN-50]